ncbi:MAG: hypothetical protein JWM91_2237 [Rhodospirillales bacterium]|nr:hypothetical protein [Rhodospirillales bacterium]
MPSFGPLFNATTEDEITKGSLMTLSFESFEIASYESLQAMAKALDLPQVARMAEQNLEEERAMASWLDDNLPLIAKEYVQLALTGHSTKR